MERILSSMCSRSQWWNCRAEGRVKYFNRTGDGNSEYDIKPVTGCQGIDLVAMEKRGEEKNSLQIKMKEFIMIWRGYKIWRQDNVWHIPHLKTEELLSLFSYFNHEGFWIMDTQEYLGGLLISMNFDIKFYGPTISQSYGF